ncbi:MAG: DeoR/GlpR family DNA-binding transcription regulator [Anaerolineae bacterium]|nr:DeoR/GlpR family DNA-binding transcription regulator [Anaerolineae bacterium]
MTTLDRHSKIVEIVTQNGQISIPEICDKFDVSEMTARRDLNELDRQGLLRRVHKGAVVNLGRSFEPPFSTRIVNNPEAKAKIGLRAAEMVVNGDSIALDVGTTTLEIVKGLKGKKNLTIITSCLQVAIQVADTLSLSDDVRLIIAGGIVRPRELSMIGAITQSVYQNYHVDKAFIGIAGISPEDGLTEYNVDDAQTKQTIIKSALKKIIVADGSKLGLTTFATVAPLSSIDTIITDDTAPEDIVEQIREKGVDVIVAD